VATVGPATRNPDSLTALINAGADVLRLNFSHGPAEQQIETIRLIREAAERVGREVGILGDVPGPKLRLDEVDGGVVELVAGSPVALTTKELIGEPDCIPVSWSGLPRAVKAGDTVFLADRRIRPRVTESDDQRVECEVEEGGPVASHQGINLPGVDVELPAVGVDDLAWVDFAADEGVDLLAVSFVQTREDIETVEQRLAARDSDIP